MHTDLKVQRRLCVIAHREYISADRAWTRALAEAADLVPDVTGRSYWMLGHKGSPIRALYEQRDRALNKLTLAHTKLANARQRLSRGRSLPVVARLRITHRA